MLIEQINELLLEGKIIKAIELAIIMFNNSDEEEWRNSKYNEYIELFPTYRPSNDAELFKQYQEETGIIDKDKSLIDPSTGIVDYTKWLEVMPKVVKIDYTNNDDYITFNEWLDDVENYLINDSLNDTKDWVYSRRCMDYFNEYEVELAYAAWEEYMAYWSRGEFHDMLPYREIRQYVPKDNTDRAKVYVLEQTIKLNKK